MPPLVAEIFNAEVVIREDASAGEAVRAAVPPTSHHAHSSVGARPFGSHVPADADDFIDVVVGKRKYMRWSGE